MTKLFDEMYSIEDLEKMVAQRKEEAKKQELDALEAEMKSVLGDRFLVERSAHSIALFNHWGDDVECDCYGIWGSLKSWRNTMEIFAALQAPSESEIQKLEYQMQESEESRRNGWGAE